MIKSFLILLSFSIFLHSSQQIVLVVADNFNTSQAKLECFEDEIKVFNTIDVNIGKKGLGWGLGEINLSQKKQDPIKYEGDKKAPSGVFKLTSTFGYSKSNNTKIIHEYIAPRSKLASKNLICVDDSNSNSYNTIIKMPTPLPKSFEFMRRDDIKYELGIVVQHNFDAIKQRGSCIFIHVQIAPNTGTPGCTSMKLDNLKKIVHWLDKDKNPILIQIPKSSQKEILKLYPQLRDSKLLD